MSGITSIAARCFWSCVKRLLNAICKKTGKSAGTGKSAVYPFALGIAFMISQEPYSALKRTGFISLEIIGGSPVTLVNGDQECADTR
jgi:hypothetical protein